MSTAHSARAATTLKARLETLIALSRLLERVEADPARVGAEQYRTLVRQVTHALDTDLPEDALRAVLGAYPAAALLYENLHYAHAGLSRSTLERSVQSEMAASQLLDRVAKSAARGG